MRGVVIAAACAEVLTLWHTLRRYMVGLDGSLTLQHAVVEPADEPVAPAGDQRRRDRLARQVALGEDMPQNGRSRARRPGSYRT